MHHFTEAGDWSIPSAKRANCPATVPNAFIREIDRAALQVFNEMFPMLQLFL